MSSSSPLSSVPPPLPPRRQSQLSALASLRVDQTQPPTSAPDPAAFSDPTTTEMDDPNYREFDYDNHDLDEDGYLSHASFGHVGVTDGSTSLSGQSAPGVDGTAIRTSVKRTWGESIKSAWRTTRETLRGLFGLSAADPEVLEEAYNRHLQLLAEEDREAAELARVVAGMERSHLLDAQAGADADADVFADRDGGLHRRHGVGLDSRHRTDSLEQVEMVASAAAANPLHHRVASALGGTATASGSGSLTTSTSTNAAAPLST